MKDRCLKSVSSSPGFLYLKTKTLTNNFIRISTLFLFTILCLIKPDLMINTSPMY